MPRDHGYTARGCPPCKVKPHTCVVGKGCGCQGACLSRGYAVAAVAGDYFGYFVRLVWLIVKLGWLDWLGWLDCCLD